MIYVLEQNLKKCIPYKCQFYYIKVGCTGVYITRTCKHDEFTENVIFLLKIVWYFDSLFLGESQM